MSVHQTDTLFEDPFSEAVWQTTYRDHNDTCLADTFHRVAAFVASAEVTEELCEHWTEQFFSLLSSFNVTAGGRIYSNAGTEWGGTTLANCFTSDVEILTSVGPKKICEMEIGDLVLTHTGKWKPVANVLCRKYTGNLLRISSSYLTNDLFSTPDHLFFQSDKNWTKASGIDHCVLGSNTETTIQVYDLVEEIADCINLVEYSDTHITPTYYKMKGNTRQILRHITLDEDFAYFLGRFIGDGSTSTCKSQKSFKKRQFDLVFNDNERDQLTFCKDIIDRCFGIDSTITGDFDTYVRIQHHSPVLATFLNNIVGDDFKTKRIPEKIWTTSNNIKLRFIQGIFDADGYVGKDGNLRLTLANEPLTKQIQSLMCLINIPSTVKLAPMSKSSKHKSWYLYPRLQFANLLKLGLSKTYDDDRMSILSKRKSFWVSYDDQTKTTSAKDVTITEEPFTGYVYNISVEDDESYVVNNAVVHNCFVGPRQQYDCDSLGSIFAHLHSQSQTLKSEGGWGENFSYIRPRGAFIHGIGVESPGTVKYMEAFDKMSEIITSGAGKESSHQKAKGKIRKGAMMSVLDCWHPDIIEFITAKQTPGRLSKFNMSVNCSDEFMVLINKVNSLRNQQEEIKQIDSDDLIKFELENKKCVYFQPTSLVRTTNRGYVEAQYVVNGDDLDFE